MEPSATASAISSNVDYETLLLNEDVTTNDGLQSCQDEQEQHHQQQTPCKICGVCDARKMCRFIYNPATIPTVDPPTSASEDVYLHVFCGKTAAILSHIEKPDLEILTAQGIRNKHGNATGVYVALKRTRSSVPVNDFDETPKVYYLSKEFEAHLAIVKTELEAAAAYNASNATNSNIQSNANVPPILPAPPSSSSPEVERVQIVSNPIQPYSGYDENTPSSVLEEGHPLPPISPEFHQHSQNKRKQAFGPNNTDNQQMLQPQDLQHDMMLPSKKQKHESDTNADLVHSPTDIMSHPQILTPYQIKMDRIRVVMEQHNASGYSIIRGVSCSNGDDDDDDDEEDENIDVNQLSQEQMNALRVILYTPQREQIADEYSRLILGDQYGKDFMMFNTSFSYHVLYSYQVFRSKYSKVRDAAVKFDMLLAFTDTLKEHDVWMHDHEEGWGGEKMVVGLARTWKNLLSRSDEQLGIDTEFTRSGAVAFLEDFKIAVEGANAESTDAQMKFRF